jgi:chemotaxis protein CheY-P-specific phosphatase CheC
VIFEELCFILPHSVDKVIGNEPSVGAVVSFNGPFSGKLLVRVTRNIMPVLSANMLGDDEPPDARMEQDAIGEIANVICGNLLPTIAGAEAIFHLESPVFFEGFLPAGTGAPLRSEAEIHIGLDSGKADVVLYVADGSLR